MTEFVITIATDLQHEIETGNTSQSASPSNPRNQLASKTKVNFMKKPRERHQKTTKIVCGLRASVKLWMHVGCC